MMHPVYTDRPRIKIFSTNNKVLEGKEEVLESQVERCLPMPLTTYSAIAKVICLQLRMQLDQY